MSDEPITSTDPMEAPEPSIEPSFDQETYNAVQNLIARLSAQLDELNQTVRSQREMLSNVYENDATLAEAKEKVQAIKNEEKAQQTKLAETEEVIGIKTKIAEITEDIKMVKESLNTHLLNYYQMTGSTTVDLPDGTEREFTVNANLKPKKS
jgi:predicted  nucleic acid-binding Zn-ribbon protein